MSEREVELEKSTAEVKVHKDSLVARSEQLDSREATLEKRSREVLNFETRLERQAEALERNVLEKLNRQQGRGPCGNCDLLKAAKKALERELEQTESERRRLEGKLKLLTRKHNVELQLAVEHTRQKAEKGKKIGSLSKIVGKDEETRAGCSEVSTRACSKESSLSVQEQLAIMKAELKRELQLENVKDAAEYESPPSRNELLFPESEQRSALRAPKNTPKRKSILV